MREVIAYELGKPDNGGNRCSSWEKVMPGMAGLAVCPSCGFRTDFEYTNPAFRLPSRRYDLSCTCDGASIASDKFRQFCEAEGYPSLRFISLLRSKGSCHFLVDRVLAVDADRPGIHREHPCAECGNLREVYGDMDEIGLPLDGPLGDGVWRSDLLVGGGNARWPLLYVGPVTRDRMRAAGLKGLHFRPRYGA
jgi:hypothetical protein